MDTREHVDAVMDRLRSTLAELFPDYTPDELQGAVARLILYARQEHNLPPLESLQKAASKR